MEAKLGRAEIINPAELNANGKAVFGAWVDLWVEQGDREVRYQIVGELEANVDTIQPVNGDDMQGVVSTSIDDELAARMQRVEN